MKNFTIAIISIVLLWGLSGCLNHAGYQVSGAYSNGYPYTHFYFGAFYDDYPWGYPFGFYSFRYGYNHNSGYSPHKIYHSRPAYHDSHKHAIHKSHDDHRTDDRHLKQGEVRHRWQQRQKDRPRREHPIVRDGVRHSDNRLPAAVQRSISPRLQEQRPVHFRRQNIHRQQENPVVRSEPSMTGKQNFKRGVRANERRLRCAGDGC